MAFLAAIVLLFHCALLGKPIVQVTDGFNLYEIDRNQMAGFLKKMVYPVWDSYRYGGIPWQAGLGALSPLNVLHMFLPIGVAATVSYYLQFFLLLAGIFYLLKNSGRSFLACGLFSAFFMGTGQIIFYGGYSPATNTYIALVWSILFLHLFDGTRRKIYLVLFYLVVTFHFLDFSYHHSFFFMAYLVIDRVFLGRKQLGWQKGVFIPFVIFSLAFLTAMPNIASLVQLIFFSGRVGAQYARTFLVPVKTLLTSAVWVEEKGISTYLYFGPVLLAFFLLGLKKDYREKGTSALHIATALLVLAHIIPGYVLSRFFPQLSVYDPFRFNFLLGLIFVFVGSRSFDVLVSNWNTKKRDVCILGDRKSTRLNSSHIRYSC
jgi:hypothetical protein